MIDRPRVLVIAEAANPEFVSVPLIGWSLTDALRQVADVHLVTQVRNREALLRAGLVEGTDFTAIDSERVARPLWKAASFLRGGEGKGWTTVQAISAVAYPYFEALVWKKFGDRIKTRAFDIVHRITPLSPTTASSLAVRCRKAGVPFVLGPLNGGVPWPDGFAAERHREREWLSYVRNAYKLLPGVGKTFAAASAILVGSRHTESEIPPAHRARCIYLPENGIDPARFSRQAHPGRHEGPLVVGFVGRMVPYKGPDMLIEAAMPLVRDGLVRLEMIGDGPMLPQLRELAADQDGVTFHGWLAHAEVQNALATCDLFGFPSVREFGGGAVLEAMALGVPPLIVDYAGPGELVTAERGYKITLGSREHIIRQLRIHLSEIAADRAGLARKGAAARQWVEATSTWPRRAEQIVRVYDWVLGRTTSRPELFEPDTAATAADVS
jgi:glycosyltransferase involved in cell wall biosynthesis